MRIVAVKELRNYVNWNHKITAGLNAIQWPDIEDADPSAEVGSRIVAAEVL
jgi:hypothetical protein